MHSVFGDFAEYPYYSTKNGNVNTKNKKSIYCFFRQICYIIYRIQFNDS